MRILQKNACQCKICGAPADRHDKFFQCTAIPAHFADVTTGTFSDHTHPSEKTRRRLKKVKKSYVKSIYGYRNIIKKFIKGRWTFWEDYSVYWAKKNAKRPKPNPNGEIRF